MPRYGTTRAGRGLRHETLVAYVSAARLAPEFPPFIRRSPRMRSSVFAHSLVVVASGVLTLACSRGVTVTSSAPTPAGAAQVTGVTESDVRRLLGALAHDSMEGRGTA